MGTPSFIHETLPEEIKALEYQQLQRQNKEFSEGQSRQMTKAFLTAKAFEFINLKQAVPCTRKSRRAAARELAKRFLKKIQIEDQG